MNKKKKPAAPKPIIRKLIKCNLPVTSINIGTEIIRFADRGHEDRTFVVSEYVAKKLLSREGYEFIKDITNNVEKLKVKIVLKLIEKIWNAIKGLLSGGKK